MSADVTAVKRLVTNLKTMHTSKHITPPEIEKLKSYLSRMENIRKLNDEHRLDLSLNGHMPNWLAIEQAKDISGWLNIYEESTEAYWKGIAEQQLLSFIR